MIVPRNEMEYFIDFMKSGGDEGYKQIEYIENKRFSVKEGDKVRILSGAFKDKEGVLVKVNGKHRKQIIVSVGRIFAVEIICPNSRKIIEIIRE